MAKAMDAKYRFKPRGSVETADVTRQRSDLMTFLAVLPQLVTFWPAVGQMLSGNAQAARAVLEQALRLFRFPDRQAILGNDAQAAMQQAMQPQQAPPMAGGPGPGGMPSIPGMPMAGGPMPGAPPAGSAPPGVPPTPL